MTTINERTVLQQIRNNKLEVTMGSFHKKTSSKRESFAIDNKLKSFPYLQITEGMIDH